MAFTSEILKGSRKNVNASGDAKEGLIKSVGHPSGAKAPASYWAFTDGLKAVPFKEPNLIRGSLVADYYLPVAASGRMIFSRYSIGNGPWSSARLWNSSRVKLLPFAA